MPGFNLGRQIEQSRPADETAVTGLPRERVHAMLDRQCHEPVPGWMELDLVDAVAEGVVSAKLRREAVGVPSPSVGLSGADARPV